MPCGTLPGDTWGRTLDRFTRNVRALSTRNPELCARLKAAGGGPEMYGFRQAGSGDTVPVILGCPGPARPLHSTVNPKREAERLVSSTLDGQGGFAVFLGLGAGYFPQAALNLPGVLGVLVIDYGIDGIAGLFRAHDYSDLLGDPRVTLLVDPPPALVEDAVTELYRPAVSGGMKVLPLRARVEHDREKFGGAGDALRRAMERVSADYSVQAHFGRRWFSNIIRNVMAFPGPGPLDIPPVQEAAICAAGPSLDAQIPLLLERKARGGPFVISTDTALPALVRQGLRPDAVVSMDCQHISYQHFMGSVCRDVPLFLDIASPPLLSGLCAAPVFFCGGHPLAMYLRRKWAPLPVLDTSGGNVTFACLSLAESLGAGRILVCGADFSYPAGKIYARGTYVFPYFERRQDRLSPLESQASAFLFRSPFLPRESTDGHHRYETATMRSYRQSFERKISGMAAGVTVMPGLGVPVVATGTGGKKPPPWGGRAKPSGSVEFLEGYARDIRALPPLGQGWQSLDTDSGQVFATLLPLMAALKHRRPELSPPETLEAARRHSLDGISAVLKSIP